MAFSLTHSFVVERVYAMYMLCTYICMYVCMYVCMYIIFVCVCVHTRHTFSVDLESIVNENSRRCTKEYPGFCFEEAERAVEEASASESNEKVIIGNREIDDEWSSKINGGSTERNDTHIHQVYTCIVSDASYIRISRNKIATSTLRCN